MAETKQNVKQAVPFFAVSNMETSLQFYMNGLGFNMTNQWIPKDKIEWCFLQLGGTALMLQEFKKDNVALVSAKKGVGVSICFICENALELYREFLSRGINAKEPFVGNNMWVTSVSDPDGYNLYFESDTDVPEETIYSEWEGSVKS